MLLPLALNEIGHPATKEVTVKLQGVPADGVTIECEPITVDHGLAHCFRRLLRE
jgi:hypothetical protein